MLAHSHCGTPAAGPRYDRPVTRDEDACIDCGRSTAPGTRLFPSRKRAVDRETEHEGYLCAACQAGSAVVGPNQRVPLSGRYVVIDLPGGNLPGGFPG